MQYIISIMITTIIFLLYYLLAYIVFDIIPWNGDGILMEIDTLFGLINSPVLRMSEIVTPSIVEIFSFIYLMFIPYIYLYTLFIPYISLSPKTAKVTWGGKPKQG